MQVNLINSWFGLPVAQNGHVTIPMGIKTFQFVPCRLKKEITGSASRWSDAYFIWWLITGKGSMVRMADFLSLVS